MIRPWHITTYKWQRMVLELSLGGSPVELQETDYLDAQTPTLVFYVNGDPWNCACGSLMEGGVSPR